MRIYRRTISLFIAAAVLACAFSACEQQAADGVTLTVYYPSGLENERLGDAVSPAEIGIGPSAHRVTEAVNALLSPPEGRQSPYSADVECAGISFDTENPAHVIIDFSRELRNMSATELAMAEACATLTLCAINGVESVTFTVEGSVYMTGADRLSAEDIITGDLRLKPVERETVIYFTDGGGSYVVSELRSIIVRENEQIESYVIEELIKGPIADELSPVIPEGTKLLSIGRENGFCYVNFSEEFIGITEDSRRDEVLALYAITNSLCELEGIAGVQYMVEGERIYGNSVMRSNENVNEAYLDDVMEATLYVPDFSASGLAPVGTRISTSSGFDLPRMLAESLITGIDGYGFMSPFPQGTRINSLRVDNLGGECIIDYSRELTGNLEEGISIDLVLQSVAWTLKENGIAESVRIYIDGEEFQAGQEIRPDEEYLSSK